MLCSTPANTSTPAALIELNEVKSIGLSPIDVPTRLTGGSGGGAEDATFLTDASTSFAILAAAAEAAGAAAVMPWAYPSDIHAPSFAIARDGECELMRETAKKMLARRRRKQLEADEAKARLYDNQQQRNGESHL